VKDRLGLSKKLAKKKGQEALDYGLRHSEVKGHLRRFIDKTYLAKRTADNIRIFNQKVYLFDSNVLITVINLPQNLCRTANKMQQKKRESMNKET
jgi:hypothetical protein